MDEPEPIPCRRPIGRVSRTRAMVVLAVACLGLLGVASCQVQPGDPGASDVVLTIDLTAPGLAISPLIYGTNGTRDLATNRQTLVRSGGNRLTAYNWETNASNAGSDWLYQNDGYLSASNAPNAAITPMIDQAVTGGAAAIVTVPMVDRVAGDKDQTLFVHRQVDGQGQPRLVVDDVNFQQGRFKLNQAAKGSAFSTSPNAGDGVVYQDEMVNWIKTNRPGATVIYSLDNEPDLWAGTHPEVHGSIVDGPLGKELVGTPVTYAELVTRTTTFARAIKNVAPNATVIGPVSYGFYGFERLQGAPDAANRNFLDFYLDQMKAADTTAGKRLVDVLDLHWYPEATGGGVRITGTDTGAAVVAARVQAPRSLWDPSYSETSWITGDYAYGPIRLIPRTLDRIATRDPGLGLGFTEWNYGGGGHISGAVASADVLGIFGRHGVTLANLWELNGDESYTYAAFRAFRNYDGQGGAFGDVSRPAGSSDVATATVYASTFSSDPKKPVIIVINKATTAKKAGIKVTSEGSVLTKAEVRTITAGGGAALVAQPDITTVATNAFNYTMPPLSVSVLVPAA